MSILSVHYKRLKTKKFEKNYGSITEGVDIEDNNSWKTLYYPIFLMQRLAFAAILVFLYSSPLTQCIIFGFLNLLMILYIGCAKPFGPFWERISVIYDEVVLMIFLGFIISLFFVPDMDFKLRKGLGYVVIAFIIASILKNLIIMIRIGYLGRKEKKKQKKPKKEVGAWTYQLTL